MEVLFLSFDIHRQANFGLSCNNFAEQREDLIVLLPTISPAVRAEGQKKAPPVFLLIATKEALFCNPVSNNKTLKF